MSIIDELLSGLNDIVPVRDIRQGAFQTAVMTRDCGLASTPHDPGPHHNKSEVAEAGSLLKLEAMSLARLALSPSQNEAAIGMAAINSLIEVNEGKCMELNAADLLLQKGEGKRVAIIGHFPFIPRLRKAVKELWVIEKNPGEGDLPEAAAEELLPKADVIGYHRYRVYQSHYRPPAEGMQSSSLRRYSGRDCSIIGLAVRLWYQRCIGNPGNRPGKRSPQCQPRSNLPANQGYQTTYDEKRLREQIT